MRLWDNGSGREVRQVAGSEFAFVQGATKKQLKTKQHLLKAQGDMLLIKKMSSIFRKRKMEGADPLANNAPVAAGNADDAPVASFKAPLPILSVQCQGATICVECEGGAVCILLAPFLAV